MKALWTYTLARLGVFLATYAALWGIGWAFIERGTLTNLVVLFAAMVISSIISLYVLAGLRQQLADDIAARAENLNRRIEESRRAEDVD